MEATDIQKKIAGGKIPLSFDMHESEVTSLHRPPIFYVMAPRMSYLPLVSRSARESFGESAPDVGESGVWYEYESKPLRWNVPIGVLFDYYRNTNNDDTCDQNLPFRITIRFQGFPKANLLPCAAEIDVENAFFNSMKQALSLKFGSAKRLMEISKASQENLWDGIVFNKFDKYWEASKGFLIPDDQYPKAQAPIRLLIRRKKVVEIARALQASVPLTKGTTLKESLQMILNSNAYELDLQQARVIIQGVSPPLDAPVTELCDELCAPDLFLYVILLA